MEQDSVLVISEPDRAAGALNPLRRRILEELDAPQSATALSKKLGLSRQKVNYHLRNLEEAGLVELVEVRQQRGLEERVMKRSADIVMIDPSLFANIRSGNREAAGLSGVVTTAADLIRHSAAVADQAQAEDEALVTVTLDSEVRVSSPQTLRRMIADIGDVISRHNSEEGLQLRVVVNALPTPVSK